MGNYLPTAEETQKLLLSFRSIKAESDDVIKSNMAEAFVATEKYFDAQKDGKAIIIGRKGSGKSALILGYKYFHECYYRFVAEIDADEIPLTTLYNYFLKNNFEKSIEIKNIMKDIITKEEENEISTFTDPVRLSTFAWERAFLNYGLYLGSQIVIEDVSTTKENRELLNRVRNKIRGQFDDTDPTAFLYALYTENYDDIKELIEETINSFVGSAWGKLIGLIGNKIIGKFRAKPEEDFSRALQLVKSHYNKNDWRVLVTFDRFDDFYDKHYNNLRKMKDIDTIDLSARYNILSSVLEGLILSVSSIKNRDDYSWYDLLFTVPMDKFMELDLRERARIEFENTIPLEWSPRELFDFVNKRITLAIGDKIPDGKTPWYYIFPEYIKNRSVNNIPEDSFLYVLRHTMWKPREVLMYVNRLISESFNGGLSYDDDSREQLFRDIVCRQSKEIIRQEFNEEFKSQYPRLWQLTRQLQNDTIHTIMDMTDFMDAISGASLSSDITEKDDIIRRLYKMGFIGVRKISTTVQKDIDATVTQDKQEVSYKFYYNSKDFDPFAANVKICFHPLFFDEIEAIHEKPYIVNELKWEMFSERKNRSSIIDRC